MSGEPAAKRQRWSHKVPLAVAGDYENVCVVAVQNAIKHVIPSQKEIFSPPPAITSQLTPVLSVRSPTPRLVLNNPHVHTSVSLTHSVVGSRFLLTGNARPSLQHSAPVRSASILNTTPALSGIPQNTEDEALCPLCHFASAWRSIPGISHWVRNIIENGYMLQFRRRPPRFNGVVMSTVPAHNEPVLRQEVLNLLTKRAIEVVPPSERERAISTAATLSFRF